MRRMRHLGLKFGGIRRSRRRIRIDVRLGKLTGTDAVLEKDIEFFIRPTFNLREAEVCPNHNDKRSSCPEETYHIKLA